MIEPLAPLQWARRLNTLLDATYENSPDRFPVKVEQLAKNYSLQRFPNDPITLVHGDDLPGFDGALHPAPAPHRKDWAIIYNKAVNSPGRINFTLAHEFGHYLLHRQDYPNGIQCKPDDMVRWDSDYTKIERQANEFAAALLMPLPDYCQQIKSQTKPTLKDISACAERYGVSLTAATLRWLEYTACRAILVLSRDGFILWSRSSCRALKTGAYFRTANQPPVPMPEASLPMQPDWLYNGTGWITHEADIWLDEPCVEIALLSDQYDFAISLLHLYDVVSRCDSDDFD